MLFDFLEIKNSWINFQVVHVQREERRTHQLVKGSIKPRNEKKKKKEKNLLGKWI